jgi:hypothetical protein
MTEREKFWQMLTAVTSPRSFKYDADKFQMSIELPILPENVKDFKKNILSIFGDPKKPTPDWDSDPIFHNYKFNPNFISIDEETIKYNKYGQLSIAEDNIIDSLESKILDKLGIDVKNDEIHLDSFHGLSKISQKPFIKTSTSYSNVNSGLDYSDLDNWYLFPQHTAGLLDIFILYPTTVYDSKKDRIIEVTDMEMSKGVNEFLKVIIPIFKDLPVNLYMPKYRQFNGAFIEKYSLEWFANNARSVLDDVCNAFNYFIVECQSSEQFITFSHDQGSLLNYFLATDFVKYISQETKDKWSNVWALGLGLDDTILNHTHFSVSGLPTDKKTIISWNLSTESELTKNRKTWGDGTSMAVNPITFTKTYTEQVDSDCISLLSYFNKNLRQVQNLISAKITPNQYENELIQVNINENQLLTDDQKFILDTKNIGYLHDSTIGLFVESIRNNIISRYSLGN